MRGHGLSIIAYSTFHPARSPLLLTYVWRMAGPNVSPKTMQQYLLDDATVSRRTVRLHELCSTCTSFGVEVSINDPAVEFHSGSINRLTPAEYIHFGSVSRLDPDNCHLCAMIEAFRSAASDENGMKPQEDATIQLSRCAHKLQPDVLGTFAILFSQENGFWATGNLRLEYIHSKCLA